MNSNNFWSSRAAGLVVCVLSVVWPVAAQTRVHYSRSELRTMMREANTADQCRTLVTWFRGEEATFRGKAEAENRDYKQYYKGMPVSTKLPTRADTARGLRDYYSRKADRMAAQAAHYETQLSRLDPSYRPATATASAPMGAPVPTALPSLSQNERVLLDRIERLEQQMGRPRAQ